MQQPCPSTLRAEACQTPNCQFNHRCLSCDLCGISGISQKDLDQHIVGRRHQDNINPKNKQCTICGINVSGPFSVHENGKRHRQMLKAVKTNERHILPSVTATTAVSSPPPPPPPPLSPAELVHCSICNEDTPNHDWFSHLQNPVHARQAKLMAYSGMLWDGQQDKCGVQVEEQFLDFGMIQVEVLRETPTIVGVFHLNLTSRVSVILVRVQMASDQRGNKPSEFSTRFSRVAPLKPGVRHSVNIEFTPQGAIGRFEDRAEFVFEDTTLQQRFVISRVVRAVVGTQLDISLLRPIERHDYPLRTIIPKLDIVDGIRPPASVKIDLLGTPPDAPIPPFVRDVLEDGSLDDKISRVQRVLLPAQFNSETFRHHWKVLLWIEELHDSHDLARCDMTATLGNPAQGYVYYTLNVPGLAENRPTVIIGDRVRVKKHGMQETWFGGYVHHISREQIYLHFHSTFQSPPDQVYDVQFELDRRSFRRMHMALETSFYPPRVLFPSAVDVRDLNPPTPTQKEEISVFNHVIARHEAQSIAVTAIVNRPAGSVPFIIFGPSGSGKTITLVEAIRQLIDINQSSRVLVCAPHDTAADLICELLAPIGRSQLFRLNAPSRLWSQLPRALAEFCLKKEETFTLPSLEKLKGFRVVVSTCISAAIAAEIGVPRGHFTHVFVDNATQATEPEIMIPIKTISGLMTNVILSGDPEQLGPVARSPIAQRLGLETSYMERLMKLPVYDDERYSGITIVKLIHNYRSHPAILKFHDGQYNQTLQSCADPNISNSLLKWDCLPQQGFPILFHPIKGKGERRARSPSLYNVDEIRVIKHYVRKLRSLITDDDIGVVSPYSTQCMKIRALLRGHDLNIKVGTVEEFQGLERRVIIVSTVRTEADPISYDLRNGLGFLGRPQRFHVTITRAQALLIIIGDPDVLILDPLWRVFLKYVREQGGWTTGDTLLS